MTGICRFSLLAGLGLLACGGTQDAGTGSPATSAGSGGTAQATTGGTTPNPNGGASGTGVVAGGGTINGVSGSGTGGAAPTSGSAGTPGAGSGVTMGGAGGGTGGAGDPLDTPPTHTLNVQAAVGEHKHTASGMPAALDNRLPKMMGKLIIDVEVDSGGTYDYGLKHGFHVLGPGMFHCNIAQAQNTYTAEGRDFNGNCRLETFDGVDHDTSTAAGHAMVDPAGSVSGRVKAALMSLQTQYPEEDWGYFLAADNSVRWSDVGLTGYSHGASSSVRWAKAVRVWRAVARSGPRDNLCGTIYNGQTCKEDVISSWLDEQGKTPIDRIYGLAGTTDSEYGDIVFAMERMQFMGALADMSTTQPPYTGSHRLIASGKGHLDFNDKAYWPAMDVIWAVPKENIDYANSH